MTVVQFVFYVFAFAAVIGAIMCITQRNPIASAFWLVSVMMSLAGVFVLLQAQFIGVMQVLVYAGAIMVLFLFVIMLLNLGGETSDRRGTFSWVLAVVISGAITVSMAQLADYTHGVGGSDNHIKIHLAALDLFGQFFHAHQVRTSGGGLVGVITRGENRYTNLTARTMG